MFFLMYQTTVPQVDLFHKDLVLIPIHLGAHWAVDFGSPYERMIITIHCSKMECNAYHTYGNTMFTLAHRPFLINLEPLCLCKSILSTLFLSNLR